MSVSSRLIFYACINIWVLNEQPSRTVSAARNDLVDQRKCGEFYQRDYVLWNAVSVPLPHVTHHELLRKQDCYAIRYQTEFYKRMHLRNRDDVITLCYITLSNAVTSCA